jgi:putative hydrolase of the HAD superfamily
VALGYIPSVERLRLPSRRSHPWALAPWTDTSVSDGGGASRGRRGLILDLDDTLYPREQFVRSGFAAVARHVEVTHGVAADVSFGVLTRAHADEAMVGHELEALCGRVGLARDVAPALLDVFRRHLPSIWLNHDVAETLQTLRTRGWRLGILTNGLPSVQFRKVAALGLTSLVDDIVYAEEHIAGGKPAAAAFRAALASLDLTPEQCVCVGDDLLRDVRGARAIGIRTIRIARPGVIAAPGEEADMVIESLAQLPEAAGMVLDLVSADVA